MSYRYDGTVFLDESTSPPTLAGYIFDFTGHGQFCPDGKVEATKEQIDSHNGALAKMEVEAAIKHGRALFYLSGNTVSTWNGKGFKAQAFTRTSNHFVPRCWHRVKRVSAYFTGPDGKPWYGVNIGDNSILRSRRLKH